MLNEIYKEMEDAATKAIEAFRKEIGRLRTGRASASLLDTVRVNYYNVPTPLSQIATVSAPDPRTLIVQPWDKTALPEIEKAITAADLGLNPSADASVVRVPIPALNEERRKDLVKQIKKQAEETKVIVRNLRRDYNERVKKEEKNKTITEDEMHKGIEKIQDITKKSETKIDEVMAAKEKDIMSV